MDLPLDKLAPRAIALAVVGYCVWPSLMAFQARPETKSPEKPPEVAAALLKPAVAPFPTRDPFVTPSDGPGQSFRFRAGKGAALMADSLSSLTLEATCIVNSQRLAMINGRLYACQETLSAGNASLPPFKLVDVLPYKALLECEGKRVELTYSNTDSRPISSRGARAPAKSGGAGTSKAKTGGKANKIKK